MMTFVFFEGYKIKKNLFLCSIMTVGDRDDLDYKENYKK